MQLLQPESSTCLSRPVIRAAGEFGKAVPSAAKGRITCESRESNVSLKGLVVPVRDDLFSSCAKKDCLARQPFFVIR